MEKQVRLTLETLAELLSFQLEADRPSISHRVLRENITRFSAIQYMIEAVTIAADPQTGTEDALRSCLVNIVKRAAEFGASRSPGFLEPTGTNWYPAQLRVMAELCQNELAHDLETLASYGPAIVDLAKLTQAEAATIGSLNMISAEILDQAAMNSFCVLVALQPTRAGKPTAKGTKPKALAA